MPTVFVILRKMCRKPLLRAASVLAASSVIGLAFFSPTSGFTTRHDGQTPDASARGDYSLISSSGSSLVGSPQLSAVAWRRGRRWLGITPMPKATPTARGSAPAPTMTPIATPTKTPTVGSSATPASTMVPPTRTPLPPAPSPTPLIVTPTPAPLTQTATPTAGSPSVPHVLFGLGSEADGAQSSPLNQRAPLGMYTSWYNGPGDLSWMSGWKTSFMPSIYASGRAVHLIVWSGGSETGTPCGRQYPISPGIDGDMVQLAQIFAGRATDPPLYVTLFTELQTYPCIDNQWKGAEDYYTALQAKMLQIKDIFHQYAPNARVSIGWGGWQSRWDDPANGGGRSLFPYFADVMAQMDLQSFQAMQDDGNVNDVRAMSKTLGAYGPVMLAHYKPNGGSTTTYRADITAMMTDDFLREVTGYGLFAWSFMDTAQMSSDPSIFALVGDAVLRYGRFP